MANIHNPITIRPANYIRHLNTFLNYTGADPRLAPPHISVYLELFRIWNIQRFQNPIHLVPGLAMVVCKIKSKTTYRKTLRELRDYGYIGYTPAKSATVPAQVIMYLFPDQNIIPPQTDNNNETQQNLSTTQPATGHIPARFYPQSQQNLITTHSNNINIANTKVGAPVHSVDNFKINSPIQPREHPRPQSLREAQDFFQANGSTINEAAIFFNHYAAVGWKMGRQNICDWHATARKWILRPPLSNTTKTPRNTHITTEKNYDEEL